MLLWSGSIIAVLVSQNEAAVLVRQSQADVPPHLKRTAKMPI